MRVVVTREAAADLDRLRAFLAIRSPTAARGAVEVPGRAIESQQELPDRGRPSAAYHQRELIVPFGRTAYVLRYLRDTVRDEVIVLRISHGRERRH